MKTDYRNLSTAEFDRLCQRYYYLKQLTRRLTAAEQAEMERLGEPIAEMEADWERVKLLLQKEYGGK